MAQVTNMDHSKDSKSNIPQLEFTLPRADFDEEVTVGDIGDVSIPVEVTSVSDDAVTFRKRNKASASAFHKGSLKDMEDHINEQYPPEDDE